MDAMFAATTLWLVDFGQDLTRRGMMMNKPYEGCLVHGATQMIAARRRYDTMTGSTQQVDAA